MEEVDNADEKSNVFDSGKKVDSYNAYTRFSPDINYVYIYTDV
jgi:hypothetical protein